MLDEAFARLRTHRSNIQRYRQLLDTDLTDLERRFITRRMAEEQSAIEIAFTHDKSRYAASLPRTADAVRRVPKILTVARGRFPALSQKKPARFGGGIRVLLAASTHCAASDGRALPIRSRSVSSSMNSSACRLRSLAIIAGFVRMLDTTVTTGPRR